MTLPGLLDLSVVFDTVNRAILLGCLQTAFRIKETALSWIQSFLNRRTQMVTVAGKCSRRSVVSCGVQQGSVLGPLIFLLYTADVIDIARHHVVEAHTFATTHSFTAIGKPSTSKL